MRLININCSDTEAFKYSILIQFYYYNMQKNHARVSLINKNLNPYIYIKFNESNDFEQFKNDNPLIDLCTIDVNGDPVNLTRNNADIKVNIAKLSDNRYSLLKPSIAFFRYNIGEINRLTKSTCSNYKLTDKIKRELALDIDAFQKCV